MLLKDHLQPARFLWGGGERKEITKLKKPTHHEWTGKNNHGSEPRVLTISCSTYGSDIVIFFFSQRPLAFVMLFLFPDVFLTSFFYWYALIT